MSGAQGPGRLGAGPVHGAEAGEPEPWTKKYSGYIGEYSRGY